MHRGMHHTSFFVRSLMLVAAVCLCLTQVVSAAALKLSGSTAIEGAVESFKTDPTGMYAVYSARLPAKFPGEIPASKLYSVRLSGGQPVSLNDFGNKTSELLASVNYEISPDGKWVVFTGNRYGQTIDVFVVPIQGGTEPTGLNPLALDVKSFVISPDSRWVFFSVQGSDYNFDQFHLYRAPLDGSGPVVEIKAPNGSALMVQRMQVTPDNRRLLFEGGLLNPTTWGVYSMPLEDSGSQLVKLTLSMTNRSAFFYTVTPDSQSVVYLLPRGDGYDEGIYTVPVSGPVGQNLKISGTLSQTTHVFPILLDASGSRMVFYLSDSTSASGIYSTVLPPSGSSAPNPLVRLDTNLPTGTQVLENSLVISPDGAMLAYEADGINNLGLYLAPIDGPAASSVLVRQVSGPYQLSSDLPQFSPDGQRLVFVFPGSTAVQADLFSVPTPGLVSGQLPVVTQISLPITATPLNGDATVSYPVITQDSQVVYYAAETQAGHTEVYSVPVAGPASASQSLTGYSVDGSNVANLALAPHQRGLLFLQKVGGDASALFFFDALPNKIYLPSMRR